ncbi:MAG: SH3 domain-containing protein [Steroidobacteraceae bacterium]
MKTLAATILATGLVLPALAVGDTRYVVEQLVINLTTEPGAGERLASARSADAVEVLEEQDGFARVQLRSGVEGWMKSSYLSREEPLRARLDQRQQELDKVKRELADAKRQLERRSGSSDKTTPAAPAPAAPTVAKDASPTDQAEAETGAPPLMGRGDVAAKTASRGASIGVSLLAALLAFGAGTGFGWWLLDRRIRRKYGGLRIY